MRHDGIRLPLCCSLLRFVAPVLAIAGGALVWSTAHPQVATQADIANGVGSTIAVLAPVLAGFAAWDALRERRHGGGPILDVAARPASRDLTRTPRGGRSVRRRSCSPRWSSSPTFGFLDSGWLGHAHVGEPARPTARARALCGDRHSRCRDHAALVGGDRRCPATGGRCTPGLVLMREAGLAQSLNPFGKRRRRRFPRLESAVLPRPGTLPGGPASPGGRSRALRLPAGPDSGGAWSFPYAPWVWLSQARGPLTPSINAGGSR